MLHCTISSSFSSHSTSAKSYFQFPKMKLNNHSISVLSSFLATGELLRIASAFSRPFLAHSPIARKRVRSSPLFQASNQDNINDRYDTTTDMDAVDWRAFRAQLVMNSQNHEEKEMTNFGIHDDVDGPSYSDTMDMNMNMDMDMDVDGIGSLFYEQQSYAENSSLVSPNISSAIPSNHPKTDSRSRTSTARTSTSNRQHNHLNSKSSSWGYDPGTIIEKGSIVLGGVEQDFGFGLRQQFFHKSAMMIIQHDDAKFTKAIMLNRPTDIVFVDDHENEWNVWYGGMSQDMNHQEPEITCIHTLSLPSSDDEKDANASINNIHIANNLQHCTFEHAQMLVRDGLAQPSDFWTFAGYTAWGKGALEREINEKSWYMCTTDTQTVVRELSKQQQQHSLLQTKSLPIDDVGIKVWMRFMKMTGRGETATECIGDFEDKILKEWTREHLRSHDAGGFAGTRKRPIADIFVDGKMKLRQSNRDSSSGQVSSSMSQSADIDVATKAHDIGVGSLVRASSDDRSPYLLKDQIMHKALVLILHEDEETSIGAILNQPSAQDLDIETFDRSTGRPTIAKIPIRFGGLHAQNDNDLIWLHNDLFLCNSNVGSPIGPDDDTSMWKCTQEEAISAISAGLAQPSSFLVVNGLSVWEKSNDVHGMKGRVEQGCFETIDRGRIPTLVSSLLKQKTLNWMNLGHNLRYGDVAWRKGRSENRTKESTSQNQSSKGGKTISRIEARTSANEKKRLSKLSDDALKSWVATFLLGSPSLGA